MKTQNTRDAFSKPAIARSIALGLALSVSLGGAAHAGLRDIASAARSRVRAALPTAEQLGGVVEQVDDIGLVTKLIGVVRDTRDVLDTLDAKRAGFQNYKNGGGVDRMRGDLKNLFEDLRVLSDTSQKLRCFQDPETSLVPMQVAFMSSAVERMPPLVIFGLQKVLDEAASDWRTTIADILADLPVDAVSQMCEAGSDFVDRFEAARCQVAREINPTRMARTELKANAAAKIFGVIQKFAPEDVQFALTVTVVGGGGAGTNVNLPIRGILQTIINVLDKVKTGAAKVQSIQKECSTADEKMERDLLSCTALASYDEKLDGIRDLALRRLASLNGSNYDFDAILSAGSFGQLCAGYQDFRLQ